jgi:[ribosomal protein S5]-alanine N-acetyltransferase
MHELATEHLVLRRFRPADAEAFVRLAGDWLVARMTSDIPHPLEIATARAWLKPSRQDFRAAIIHQGELIGSVGYYRRPLGGAELGFWIGRSWWGRGFATEAARAIVRFGFECERLPGFSSSYFTENIASAKVLSKLGFETVGESRIFCAARRCELKAVTCWLGQTRAVELNLASRTPPARVSWRSLLGRMAGWV